MDHYTPSGHFGDRLWERKISMPDVLIVLKRAARVVPHDDPPRHGGTCWRVLGRDVDGARTIGVGVETYLDERGRWMILCTAMEVLR